MRHGPTDGWCLPLDAAEGGRFLLFLSGAPVLPEAVCLSVCDGGKCVWQKTYGVLCTRNLSVPACLCEYSYYV